MGKLKKVAFILFTFVIAITLTSCAKKLSGSEQKRDFFYIENQYANVVNHYENDDYTDSSEFGDDEAEFPSNANDSITKIRKKVKSLKKNNTYESKLIAEYGTKEITAIKKLIKKHKNEESFSLKDINESLADKISSKYFKNQHSKKMKLINSISYDNKQWKEIKSGKRSFTVSDNTGYAEIYGNAEPGKKVKIQGGPQNQSSSDTTDKYGNFDIKLYHPYITDAKYKLSYAYNQITIPGKIVLIKHSESFANNHPQKDEKPSSYSVDIDENSNVNTDKVKTKKLKPTSEDKAALRKAEDYSDTMHMSKAGIYDQLTSDAGEGFPAEAAQYAIDHIDADWNYNALKKAQNYRDDMSMSNNELYDQLTSSSGEGFTPNQANYAIRHLN